MKNARHRVKEDIYNTCKQQKDSYPECMRYTHKSLGKKGTQMKKILKRYSNG